MEASAQPFNAQDQIDVVQGHRPDDNLVIGGKTYPVRPLNGKAAIAVFSLVKELSTSLGQASKELSGEGEGSEKIAKFVASLIGTFADQADKAIHLMLAVLQRATPGLTYETLAENMDFTTDFAAFWEIFTRQNKVDVLLKKAGEWIGPTLSSLGKVLASSPSSGSSRTLRGITAGLSTSSPADEPTATAPTS